MTESAIKNNSVCLLSHPFHRGGVTKWMVEAAEEFTIQDIETWYVTVDPVGFVSGGSRPTLKSQMEHMQRLNLIAPEKSKSFELGTLRGRSLQYAALILDNVPKGTPILLSDDESVWKTSEYIGEYYPFIGILHSDEDAYYDLFEKYKRYLSCLVVVSNRIRDKAYQISDEIDIHVIPYGIKLPEFKMKEKYETIRILWAGRIEEHQKRVSDIPKIGKALSRENVSYHWTIAGHGQEEDLRNTIIKNNLENNFTFTGWLNKRELYDKMDESDILVLTSNFEGMPLTVMEGLAKGLGIVCTRVSGLEDLDNDILAKDVIRLYEIGDIEKAVDCIRAVSELPLNERVKVAIEIAEKKYSIETCISNYCQVLKNTHIVTSTSHDFDVIRDLRIEMIKSGIISSLRFWKYQLLKSF